MQRVGRRTLTGEMGQVAGWRLARKRTVQRREGGDAHLRAQPHSEERACTSSFTGHCGSISSPAFLEPVIVCPSKRAFAKHLGVSVVTVEGAYDQLVAEGYVRAVPRSGFYVQEIGPNLTSFSRISTSVEVKVPLGDSSRGQKRALAGPKRGFLGMMASKSSKNLPEKAPLFA